MFRFSHVLFFTLQLHLPLYECFHNFIFFDIFFPFCKTDTHFFIAFLKQNWFLMILFYLTRHLCHISSHFAQICYGTLYIMLLAALYADRRCSSMWSSKSAFCLFVCFWHTLYNYWLRCRYNQSLGRAEPTRGVPDKQIKF